LEVEYRFAKVTPNPPLKPASIGIVQAWDAVWTTYPWRISNREQINSL
jgi:hypothetical protein